MPDEKPSPGNSEQPSPPPRGERPRHKHHWHLWLLAFLAVLFAVCGFLILRHPARRVGPAPPAAVAITAATVRKGDIGVYVSALGLVTPINTVTIRSQVNGEIIRVNYSEGQLVNANDLLVEIDPSIYQAQLIAAQGQYERDAAALEISRVDLARYQTAYATNAIPRQQVEDQAALVRQNEGAVKFDKGQVESAKVTLAYCRITSPISGRVGLRLVDPGNIVLAASSNALLVVTQLQPMTTIFSVAEDYLPQILEQLGAGQHLIVEAYDRALLRKIATGELLTVDNLIDPATGTVRLRAIFPNKDNALFPNQFVNARLLVLTLHNTTLVPVIAIQRSAQGAFVYVVKPNQTVAMRPIKVGVSDGNETAVEGVQPGEVVATDNFNRLQDGVRVAVQRESEGANPGTGGGP